MLCVCVGDVMDVVFSVCIVRCGAVGARVWEVECFVMQMLYVCVHPVAVLMTCSVLMLAEDARGEQKKRGILQSRSHNCFAGSHESHLLFTPSCCSECLYDLYRFMCMYCYVVDVCAVCECWVQGKTQNLWVCCHG